MTICKHATSAPLQRAPRSAPCKNGKCIRPLPFHTLAKGEIISDFYLWSQNEPVATLGLELGNIYPVSHHFWCRKRLPQVPGCEGETKGWLLLRCACQAGRVLAAARDGKGFKHRPEEERVLQEQRGPAGLGCSALSHLQLPALIISLRVSTPAATLPSKNCPTFKELSSIRALDSSCRVRTFPVEWDSLAQMVPLCSWFT